MLRVRRTAESPIGFERSAREQKGRMGMWQQLLDRFVPLMEADASALDLRDGVGSTVLAPAPVGTARTADAPLTTGRSAFDGSISPLAS